MKLAAFNATFVPFEIGDKITENAGDSPDRGLPLTARTEGAQITDIVCQHSVSFLYWNGKLDYRRGGRTEGEK